MKRVPWNFTAAVFGYALAVLVTNDVRQAITSFAGVCVSFVLLPPLIYEASLELKDFKKYILTVSVLAILGVIVSTVIVAAGLHYLLGVGLSLSLVFGSLISATDPVGIIQMMKRVRAPSSVVHILEGESIANDGTAMMLFTILTSLYLSRTNDAASSVSLDLDQSRALVYIWPTVKFFWGLLFSIGWGFLWARLVSLIFKKISNSVALNSVASKSSSENKIDPVKALWFGLNILSLYVMANLGSHLAEGSALLSIMAMAYFQNQIRDKPNVDKIWSRLSVICNVLVFGALGTMLNFSLSFHVLSFIAAGIFILIIARILSVRLSLFLSRRFGGRYGRYLVDKNLRREDQSANGQALSSLSANISWREEVLIYLGGVRGALSLSMVSLLVVMSSQSSHSLNGNFSAAEVQSLLFLTSVLVVLTNLLNPLLCRIIMKR